MLEIIINLLSDIIRISLHIMLATFHHDHLKNSKGANLIVCNIPCNFFNIESMIFQWKYNIECWLFISPPSNPFQFIVMLLK